ncbi:hypothetical protein Tco_0014907 [Tanacetum coccineum]
MHKNSLMNQTLTPILKKYDNILPLTERQLNRHEESTASNADLKASVEGYYHENVNQSNQTDKLVKETIKTINNINKAGIDERAKLLKALNRVSETVEADFEILNSTKDSLKQLKAIFRTLSSSLKFPTVCKQSIFQAFIKDSPTLKTPKSLCNLTSLQSKGWSLRCYKHLKECIPPPPQAVLLFQQLHNLKPMHLLGVEFGEKPEDEATKTLMEQELKRPTRAVPILTIRPITIPNLEVTLNESSSRPSLSDPILEIFIPQQITQVIDITPPEPQVTQRVGKGIASGDKESPQKHIPASNFVVRILMTNSNSL